MTAALDMTGDPFAAVLGTGRGSNRAFEPMHIDRPEIVVAAVADLARELDHLENPDAAIRDTVHAITNVYSRQSDFTVRLASIWNTAQSDIPLRTCIWAACRELTRTLLDDPDADSDYRKHIISRVAEAAAAELAKPRGADMLVRILMSLLLDTTPGDHDPVNLFTQSEWAQVLADALADTRNRPAVNIQKALNQRARARRTER